jgi:microsomal dipeptidase-like Zn-dependent dipeptidase
LDLIVKGFNEIYSSRQKSTIAQSDRPLSYLFSGRNEKTYFIPGLLGVECINGDLAYLEMAGKIGAKFFVINSYDESWIQKEKGLTRQGRKAIRLMNRERILIIIDKLPHRVISQIMAVSKHPVIITGITSISDFDKKFIKGMKKNGSILAIPVYPNDPLEGLVELVQEIQAKIGSQHMVIYPFYNRSLDLSSLKEIMEMTRVLKKENMDDQVIKNLLGGNFRPVFQKITPPDQYQRMRRR